jgi:Anti-sigma-K factor rskA/Sigma-70, region 4
MATFDQLSAEQRAIVELVLQQGKTYEELADMLGVPEARVRELARDALVELAPVSVRGVEQDWRGQLADYVLGQQSGPEATATKGHLRRSEAARGWTRSLLDSLEQLYSNGSMPAIPDGERGGRRRAAATVPAPGAQRGAGAAARQGGLGRSAATGFFGALGVFGAVVASLAALLLLFAVLVWPVGLLTGGDDDEPASEQAAGGEAAGAAQGEGQGESQNASGPPAGIAIVVEQDGKRQLLVQAARLSPSGEREAYEVWLYNSRGDAKTLGGQVTDQQGNYQAVGPLPQDFGDYRFIDVSREPLDRKPGHSGNSILRGRVPELRQPQQAQGEETAVLGQSVLAPPS